LNVAVPLAPVIPDGAKNSETSNKPFWLKSIQTPAYWVPSVPKVILIGYVEPVNKSGTFSEL
jgi:hypothetical protein